MNGTKVNWYSLNADETVCEHEAIDLGRAIQIVDRYIQTASKAAEDDNDDLSATTFGFRKSKTDYIQIEIFALEDIYVEHYYAKPWAFWLQKLWGKPKPHLVVVESQKQLNRKIIEYFTWPSELIARGFAEQGKDKNWLPSRSPLGNPREASVAKRICGITLAWICSIFPLWWAINGLLRGGVYVGRHSSHYADYYDMHGQPAKFWLAEIVALAVCICLHSAGWREFKLVRRMRQEQIAAKLRSQSDQPNDGSPDSR